jgi:FMN phosphatase YigB (HAD superfamily)
MPERSTPTSLPGTSSTGPAPREQAASAPPARPPATSDARLEEAHAILADDAVTVLSLDVFDTMLWRKVPEPEHLFILLGERLVAQGLLAPDLDAGAFALLRKEAERLARDDRERSGRGVEVTLREIWDRMPAYVFRGSRAVPVELEVDLERELLVPDLDVVELIRAARDRGKRVIGVSDTYFSEGELRSFMGTAPLASLKIDRVFASSAHRVGKGGGLWRIVLDELGEAPGAVLHVGDNRPVDVAVPSGLGIRAVYFERRPETLARVIHREDLHAVAPLSPYHGDYGLTALRSKVLHRTEGRDLPPELRPFWEFGAASIGPPLTGFGEWIHERARAAGVSKVFCLMREGEMLARLVNSAAASLNSPVEAVPMWLSRQVCARASIREATREELGRLFLRRRPPTVGELCSTLGIDAADVPGFEGRASARLSQPGLADDLLERITADVDLRAGIAASAAELRARVRRYVEQMRPPGEDRLVLVDLGWGATIQHLLDGLLDEGTQTVGLYLIVEGRAVPRMLAGSEVHGFLANAGHPIRPTEAFMRSPEILEQICMPDHGSQVGLTADLEPVLGDVEDLPMQTAERQTVQQGVFAFQREWARYRTAAGERLVPFHDWGQDRLRSILVRAITSPTIDEASLYAGWLHDENFGSTGVDTLVPHTSARASRHVDPESLLDIQMTDLYWPFGLAALHDEHLAKAVEAATTGTVPWEVFSSPLESGNVEIYVDRGWGFRSDGMVVSEGRRNRLGLSYAHGTVAGDIVRKVRIDPAKAPCLLRIDWIRLRCHRRGGQDPVTLDFGDPKELDPNGMRRVGPGAYVVRGVDPNIVVDVEKRVGRDVHTVDVELAFAALPLPPTGLRGRAVALKGWLRERAKRGRLGAPIRAVYTLLRRVD